MLLYVDIVSRKCSLCVSLLIFKLRIKFISNPLYSKLILSSPIELSFASHFWLFKISFFEYN